MLGLRKYGGVQVDLFWGSCERFDADIFIGLTTGEPLSVKGALVVKNWQDLAGLTVGRGQHAVIRVSAGDQAEVVSSVKSWLDGTCPLRRITLITEDRAVHDEHQAELFRQFPDEV